LLFIIILTAAIGYNFGGNSPSEADDYLRIHIRANSNDEDDQAVKYVVRDGVINFLTPLLADCSDKRDAYNALKNAAPSLAAEADKILKENGFSYTSRAEVRNEDFPTRIYDGITLSAGNYTALIIELGEGNGDNWWCVAYPPLCFTGSENVKYKSKIAEIISGFFSKEK